MCAASRPGMKEGIGENAEVSGPGVDVAHEVEADVRESRVAPLRFSPRLSQGTALRSFRLGRPRRLCASAALKRLSQLCVSCKRQPLIELPGFRRVTLRSVSGSVRRRREGLWSGLKPRAGSRSSERGRDADTPQRGGFAREIKEVNPRATETND